MQYVLFNQDLIDLITYIGIVKYSINFANQIEDNEAFYQLCAYLRVNICPELRQVGCVLNA